MKTVTLIAALLPSLAAAKVTYDDDVLPVFEQVCLNCHNPDKTKGGLDLSSFSATLQGSSGGKIVEPGDLSSSLLAVIKQSSEPKMPPEGEPLSSAQIETIKGWIEGGLLENKSSSARKPSKPKFDASLQSDPAAKPDGPPPMPEHVLLEPCVVAPRASAIHAMVASPWAPLLAVTGQRQVLLFHTESLELVGVLPFPEGDPVSLAFTPTARYLIVGGGIPGKSGKTVTFDVTNGERILTAGKEFDTVIATDLHPNLDKVATGSPSRLIKVWKTEDGSQIASIKKHTDWITALDYSPDGILLATGDRNGGVWVWESGSGNEFHTLRGHQAGITAAQFRPDSNILASASEDGSVRFWEMNNGKEIKKIDAHPGGVLAFSWARNGSFATAGRNKIAKVWKPDFGQLREIKNLPDIPTAISLNAEGTRLFIGDYNGHIAVYDTQKGDKLGQMNANPPSIESRLAFIQKLSAELPRVVSEKSQKRDQAKTERDARKQQIAKAEEAANNARRASKSAEKVLAEAKGIQPPDPTRVADAKASLEHARKESSEADQRLAKVREQLKPAEDQLAKLEAELKKSEESAKSLKRQQTHWEAARLNARAMATAAQATELAIASEDLATEFSDLARSVENARSQLRQMRGNRAKVAKDLETAKASSTEDLETTLAHLDSEIAEQRESLSKLETDLLEVRRLADQQLPEAARAKREAAALKKAYFDKLKPTP
ncbi:c-type cytochrome domain-containing protein [Haloferula chungangensis]|uniref:C-type cytochrome domain-containing protein n=1 Tax=Haloferula chungangensis TaxID=1048331 RepID=A0ABW2L3G6_9BACT